jgi:hypothetical protein
VGWRFRPSSTKRNTLSPLGGMETRHRSGYFRFSVYKVLSPLGGMETIEFFLTYHTSGQVPSPPCGMATQHIKVLLIPASLF